MPITIQDEYKYARRFGYEEAHRVWREHRSERPTVGVADHAYSECPMASSEMIGAMTPALGAYPAAPWRELVRCAREDYTRWWHWLVERALNPSPPRAVVAVDLEDDAAEDDSDDSDGSDDCYACHGSGGGEDAALRCRTCSGTGMLRKEVNCDHY